VNNQEYPAAYPGVLAVGATDAEDVVTAFSTRGAQVAVVAPGLKITSTTPIYPTYQSARGVTRGHAALSGTSQASAFVAGVAALLWSAEPQLTAPEVAARIAAYADDLGAPGRDDVYGAGRVNALRALRHPARISSGRGETATTFELARGMDIRAIDRDRLVVVPSFDRARPIEDITTGR
jgi:subtilisin family serine protease